MLDIVADVTGVEQDVAATPPPATLVTAEFVPGSPAERDRVEKLMELIRRATEELQSLLNAREKRLAQLEAAAAPRRHALKRIERVLTEFESQVSRDG